MERRHWIWVPVLIFGLLATGTPPRAAQNLLPEIEPNEAGLHVQPWFYESFLDLKEDIADAEKAGKQLVIIWEQKGCPYCREMHRVNLRMPDIVDYIKANFLVIQMNLWGDKEVTDIDGEVTTEKKLARKYRVQFTPTIQFFPKALSADNKKFGQDFEVWRLMGYWKPFHFKHTFIYVNEERYETEPNFQRWLQNRAKEYQAKGIKVELW